MRIDAHAHVWPAGWIHPAQTSNAPLVATADAYRRLLRGHNVSVGVISSAAVRRENGAIADAAARSEGALRWVAAVFPQEPRWDRELLVLDQEGLVGIRVLLPQTSRLSGGRLEDLLEYSVERSLLLQWAPREHQLRLVLELASRYPTSRHVLDHVGLSEIPPSPERLALLGLLAALPNVAIKLSGLYSIASLPYPFSDAWSWARVVLDLFGTSRTLWASDFPLCLERASFGDYLNLAEGLVPLLEARSEVLGGAAQTWLRLRTVAGRMGPNKEARSV